MHPSSFQNENPLNLIAKLWLKSEMATTVSSDHLKNWELCLFCQQSTRDKLNSPLLTKRKDKGSGCVTLIRDLNDFNAVAEDYEKFDMSSIDEGIGPLHTLTVRNAKWHLCCRGKYNTIIIKRMEARRSRIRKESHLEDNEPQEKQKQLDTRSSGRVAGSSIQVIIDKNRSQCMFCKSIEGNQGTLHRISDENVQTKIKNKANELNDTSILPVFAQGGDLFSQEKHYHLFCYSSYLQQKKDHETDNYFLQERNAFSEVVVYMEEHSSPGTTFKLSTLYDMFNLKLSELDLYTDSSKTRFKTRLVDYFDNLNEYKVGKEVHLSFREDISSLIKTSSDTKDNENVILHRAAKIVRQSVFDTGYTECDTIQGFLNQESFAPNNVLNLVQLILTGASCLTKEQPRYQESLTVTQLIVTNIIKKSTPSSNSKSKRL